MSHTKQTPAMIIRNPSVPKKHWADSEIQKAAEEIDGGRYVPEQMDEATEAMSRIPLALGHGEQGAAVSLRPQLDQFVATRDLNEVGRHPRVLEAMERLEKEKTGDPLSPEALEASWCLFEMNERHSRNQRWPGQERWLGKENEEMRRGQVMLATDFYARLVEVIGESRVLLGRYAYKLDKESKSGLLGLYVPNPAWQGGEEDRKLADPVSVQVATMQHDAETHRRAALRLKLAKNYAEAIKEARIARDMFQAAAELEVKRGVDTYAAVVNQFIRVGAVQWPYATEWTLMNFNQYGVPTTHNHMGWRTALLTMVRNRAITEEEAELAFPTGDGPAAEWYLEQLWLRRHRGYLDKGFEN